MPLHEVQIRAVRGIRHRVGLTFGGRSALVLGDNGSGKTSIVRALQWALRGEHALELGAAGAEEAFRRHVLEPTDAPHVQVTLAGGGTIEVRPGAVVADDAGQAVRAACIRSNPFLLRRQLLDILESRPIERFRFLESFLDVGGADLVWTNLSGRADALVRQAEDDTARASTLITATTAMMPPADRPPITTWDELVRAIVATLPGLGVAMQPTDGWPEVLAATARARALAQPAALEARRVSLTNAAATVEEMRQATAGGAATELLAIEAERAALAARLTDAAVLELLEHARRHFSATGLPDRCPVCGNAVDRTALLAEIELRLEAMRELDRVRARLQVASDAWESRWNAFLDQCRRIAADLGLHSLQEISARPEPPPSASLLSQRVPGGPPFMTRLLVSDPPTVETWMADLAAFLVQHVRALLAQLPPEGATPQLRMLVATLDRAAAVHDQVVALEGRAVVARRDAARLRQVAESVRAARQDYARTKFDEIAGAVARYYAIVHPEDAPDEATGAPTITLRRQREGTAFVGGTFNEQPVADPRWVYSDGHLDTVGICIFLALRRHSAADARDARLIVLDDIVLSIDLNHARRLIALLRDEFSDHQIVLLTHSELFAQWYERLVPGLARFRISGWTLEGGPHIGNYVNAMERLEYAVANETTPKVVGQAIQGLMDWWLHEARYVHGLPVPAQRGERYSMAELWDALLAMLRRTYRALGREIETELPVLRRLTDLSNIRNVLVAHENEFAQQFPLGAIREIATDVLRLVQALYCRTCCSYLTPLPDARQPAILQCRGRHLVVLPVVPPAAT